MMRTLPAKLRRLSTSTAIQYPPPATPTITIAIRRPGSANMKSTNRWITMSTEPPM